MKKQTLLIYGLTAALVGGSSLALAGDHGGKGHSGKGHGGKGHGDPEQRMQRMQDHLGLSEDQVTQIRSIRDSDLSREEKRAQVDSVFTAEQRAMIEEHRANRGERGGKRGKRDGEFEENTN